MESNWHVRVGDYVLEVLDPYGETNSLRFDEIKIIAIETNDSGPLGTDVWWHVSGIERGLMIPGGAIGEQEMLAAFQKWPGFNNDSVIAAMGCTEEKMFVCWKAPAGDHAVGDC